MFLKKKKMNQRPLKDLKKWLPKGYPAKLAEECKVSETTIFRVISGNQKNSSVRKAIIDLAEKNKEDFLNEEKRLKKLSKK